MKKKIIVSIIFIIILLFIVGIYKLGFLSNQKGYNKDGNKILEENLSEKIIECKKTGFIDYTKNVNQDEQEKIISLLKTSKKSNELSKYFCSQNRAWRAYIAQNTYTSPELLWFFSDDEDEIVRQYLASNRNLPPEIAQKLTEDNDIVLYALARNPSLSEDILQKILEKPAHLKIQESLAYNRGTTEKFQKTLASRLSHVKALVELAKNPKISNEVRNTLRKRDIKEVNIALDKQINKN